MAENVTPINKNQDTNQMPSDEVLLKLKGKLGEMAENMATHRGELGAAYKDAEKDHGINRAALKLAMKLQKQTETKSQDFLSHFNHYLKAFGLDAGTVDMFRDTSTENAATDDNTVTADNEAA